MFFKLACSVRVESWLLSFMRQGVVAGVDVPEAVCSPVPSCMATEAGAFVGVEGPSVFGEVSTSAAVPSIWWKFHKPTLRIQYEQVRMGRLMACTAGLRKRNTYLRHLHWVKECWHIYVHISLTVCISFPVLSLYLMLKGTVHSKLRFHSFTTHPDLDGGSVYIF